MAESEGQLPTAAPAITNPLATVPALARPHVDYDGEYKVLLCVKCEVPHAATRARLLHHWRGEYKMKKPQYKPIFDCIANLEAPAQRIENLPRVPDGFPARRRLPVLNGYKCTFGNCMFRTTGFENMKRHTCMEHRIERRREATPGYTCVSLQTWQGLRGQHYWIVTDENIDGNCSPVPDPPQQDWMERVTELESARQRRQHEALNVLTQGQVWQLNNSADTY